MRTAQRGVVLLAVLSLAACGGSSDHAKRRSAVSAYFKRVDQAEVPLQGQIGQIDEAFHAFSFSNIGSAERRALVRARAEIGAARSHVAAIPAPADASQVRADLVRVLALQGSVANELVQSVLFIPRFASTTRPLIPAASRLGHDLAGVKAPAPSATETGAELWTAAGCGSCHTLASSRSKGKAGPDLDSIQPSKAAVVARVIRGSAGMPAYGKALTAAQIAALADYVSSAAGRAAAGAPGAAAASSSASPDVYAQYAAAFTHYRSALAPILTGLDRLSAPSELRPILTAEQTAVTRSRALCAEIAGDLGKHDVAAANAAIQQLFDIASGVDSAEVSRQQAAAARSYDAQLGTIASLSHRIAVERQRLQTTLQ